jgi:SOS-response transcriptional repressor LexA
MPRPSRQEEAKTVIARFYAEHGGMPTIEAFALEMGYHSTSSAHHTVMGLVKSGYLAQAERGGRLLPGPGFGRMARDAVSPPTAPEIPEAILQTLPAGVSFRVLRVEDDSLASEAIRAGDLLVLAPLERTDLSDLLVLQRGSRIFISPSRKAGWKAQGVLIAQFRSYR